MKAQIRTTQKRPAVSILMAWVVMIALPWLLGGQWLPFQLAALSIATAAFGFSLQNGISQVKAPLALLACLSGYVLIQLLNPAFTQEWQTGLRVWNLVQKDYIHWLPSSISSGFTDASPLRFLIHVLTAAAIALVLINSRDRKPQTPALILVAVSGTLIALIGTVQSSLDSRTILGIFDAKDRGLGLFFGTLLYKNQAAVFFNIAMAVSLACFIYLAGSPEKQRSNPSLLFILCAIVLLIGIVTSRSRFGFVCSFTILVPFGVMVIKRMAQWRLSRKWVMTAGVTLSAVIIAGSIFLFRSPAAKHLKTLNSEITEDFSFKQRKFAYESGFEMFASKPAYGWGAGNFRHGFRQFQNMQAEREEVANPFMKRHEQSFFWQHMHNDYLEWLIELGVVGTLILFSIPGYFFWRIFKSSRWKEPVPLMLLAGLASTMIHALVDFPFQNPAILVTWFAVLAITTNYCEGSKNKEHRGKRGIARTQ